MSTHLHLVGGAGKIGTTLADSLLAEPFEDLTSLSIYCDITKANGLHSQFQAKADIPFQVTSYSNFSLQSVVDRGWTEPQDRHIVCLLRGVNDKRFWLNQPLEAMNIQRRACSTLLESDIPLHPHVSIFHFSSQLCDLLEGESTLEDVCGGLECYRRPYIISRLHQEALLTAYAFQHQVPTTFIRLASVYGFEGESSSPWVLTTLARQWATQRRLDIRNPDALVYLTHRDPLISFLRRQLQSSISKQSNHTTRYITPPMLPMKVELLARVIQFHDSHSQRQQDETLLLQLAGDPTEPESSVRHHLSLLQSSVARMLSHS